MAYVQQVVCKLPFGTVKVNAVFGGAPGGAAHPVAAAARGSVTDPSSWTR